MEMEKPTGAKKDRSAFVTLPVMEEKGFVVLKPYEGAMPQANEWEPLEYVDWKSGGDTNFAILASANGDHDPRGFWEHGKPDKDGVWVQDNIEKSPTVKKWVETCGANFGRVRIIKLEPGTLESAMRSMHPDDNNRITEEGTGWVVRAWLQLTDNPDSYMIVRDDPDDPSTESRIPLPRGAQFVVDSERLHHVVWHDNEKYDEPRYAVIASYESGPELQSWIDSQLP
ncbi:MAG TPA: hypothetical protein VE754_02350 [Actinomycetota bacterium]|jgi:hypothetical protein|nr:hypothetical protein [Actinomycetota bacterium]